MLNEDNYLKKSIDWKKTGVAEFPYSADIDGNTLKVRVNDFPAEAFYTLLINDREFCDLDDWPDSWVKPK